MNSKTVSSQVGGAAIAVEHDTQWQNRARRVRFAVDNACDQHGAASDRTQASSCSANPPARGMGEAEDEPEQPARDERDPGLTAGGILATGRL